MFLCTYVSFDVLKVTKTSSGLFKQKRNVLKKYVFAHRITVFQSSKKQTPRHD